MVMVVHTWARRVGNRLPVRMLASSSWLGWLASLMLEDAEENGRSRLHGEFVEPPGRRNSTSRSAGMRVDDASDERSPACHHPPHAPDRRFGLYRGGPRKGTAIVSMTTEQTNNNRARKQFEINELCNNTK